MPLIHDAGFALAAAATGSGFLWLAKRLSDLAIERKYSLSGEYKATYHDLVDQQETINGGTIILKQKGLRVKGTHTDSDAKRSWSLNGEIDKNTGHIYGDYKAQGHVDSGVGVFIFEPTENDMLSGIWAGYDHKNRKINHGGYTLTKRLPINIRRAKRKDVAKILHVACTTLGDGYLSDEDILQSIKKDLFYVAEYEDKIIGFCRSHVLGKGDLRKTVLKTQAYKVPTDLKMADKNGMIGLIDSIGTDPNFQGKGVGGRLIKKSVDALEKAGAQQILSVGWKTESIHIGPVLLASNFIKRAEFTAYWKEESIKEGYDCPACGSPPCSCDAVLFSRT